MDETLISVRTENDILPANASGPVGKLLRYHNLDAAFEEHERAELLIGMCMDHRKHLRIPPRFAYVLRAGGANVLRPLEFHVSYAVAVGGIAAICLIGHDDCGMADLASRREAFIGGLVERAGWGRSDAGQHFDQLAPRFEIYDPKIFLREQVRKMRKRYPRIAVGALFYRVEDGLLYQMDGGPARIGELLRQEGSDS
jgi:carbonic anhydrase